MNLDNDIASDTDELLILVDRQDNELGVASKAECHTGSGLLHRAFSIFIFNSSGAKFYCNKEVRPKNCGIFTGPIAVAVIPGRENRLKMQHIDG
tara:strand:+ start:111 stop:392 length:282 start_codon:yes stop_codon:yes gene_type:complete